MAKYMGLWIDRSRARLVELSDEGKPGIATIESNVGGRHRANGSRGIAPPGHLGGNPDKRIEHHREQELRRYYDSVIHAVSGAERLVVMDPAQAKEELMKVLEHHPSVRRRVIAVQTADKLTVTQIADRTREALNQAHTRTPWR